MKIVLDYSTQTPHKKRASCPNKRLFYQMVFKKAPPNNGQRSAPPIDWTSWVTGVEHIVPLGAHAADGRAQVAVILDLRGVVRLFGFGLLLLFLLIHKNS